MHDLQIKARHGLSNASHTIRIAEETNNTEVLVPLQRPCPNRIAIPMTSDKDLKVRVGTDRKDAVVPLFEFIREPE